MEQNKIKLLQDSIHNLNQKVEKLEKCLNNKDKDCCQLEDSIHMLIKKEKCNRIISIPLLIKS